MVILSMIIINLSFAAVIDGLQESRYVLESSYLNKSNLEELVQLWSQYDKKATGFISTHDLICLIYELLVPSGRNRENERLKTKEIDSPSAFRAYSLFDVAQKSSKHIRSAF